jgi:hypothetical protein
MVIERILYTEVSYRNRAADNLTEEERLGICCNLCGVPGHLAMDCPAIQCGKSGLTRTWTGQEIQDHWPQSTKDLIERIDIQKANGDYSEDYQFRGRTKPCGIIETQWDGSRDCCDVPPEIPLAFIEAPAGTLQWNRTYLYKVQGGTPPYTWGIQGVGLSIAGNGASAIVSVGDCFCDPGLVICQDACNRQVSLQAISAEGYWSGVYLGPAVDGQEEGPGLPQQMTVIYGTAVKFFLYQTDTYQIFQAQWGESGEVGSYGGDCDIERPVAPTEWGPEVAVYPSQDDARDLWGLGFEDYTLEMYDSTGDGYADAWAFINIPCDVDSAGIEYVDHIKYIKPDDESDIIINEWKCDTAWDELLINYDASIEEIADNSFGWVYWEGGKPPFQLAITGTGFWFDEDGTQSTIQRDAYAVAVYTTDACGMGRLTIQDACEEIITYQIRASDGKWVPTTPVNQTSCDGVAGNSTVNGGSWELDTSGYSPVFELVVENEVRYRNTFNYTGGYGAGCHESTQYQKCSAYSWWPPPPPSNMPCEGYMNTMACVFDACSLLRASECTSAYTQCWLTTVCGDHALACSTILYPVSVGGYPDGYSIGTSQYTGTLYKQTWEC